MMTTTAAIIGGGITAALASHLLAMKGPVTLYRPLQSSFSRIPEIIPRKVFFSHLPHIQQESAIYHCKPDLTTVVWDNHGRVREILLSSDKDYFLYDKAKLVDYLLSHIPYNVRSEFREISSIEILTGYTSLYDCRGTTAVLNDPSYTARESLMAKTACRYLVRTGQGGAPELTMKFWSRTHDSGHSRTYFRIPVGNNKVSFGCSSHPSEPVSEEQLLTFFHQQKLSIDKDEAVHRGFVTPQPLVFHCQLPHVIPLGNAHRAPCPLTEYGMLAALKQIVSQLSSLSGSDIDTARRFHDKSDPHLPVELFYE